MKASPNLHPSRAMLLGLLLGLCGVSALAQETRSTILGTVKDTSRRGSARRDGRSHQHRH